MASEGCRKSTQLIFFHHGGGLGGAPLSLLQLAGGLRQSGYESEVVFTSPGPVLEIASYAGVQAEVVRLPAAFSYGMHVPLRARMVFRCLTTLHSTLKDTADLLERKKPDLVHLNSSVLLPVAIATRRLGIPLVWHVREVPGPQPQIREWLGRQIISHSDAVIATSQYVRDALPASDRIHVVHNGVRLEKFRNDPELRRRQRKAFNIPPGAQVISILGNVQAAKGHFFLLQAAPRVLEKIPDARFIVASGGVGVDYGKSWKGQVKKLLDLPLDNREELQRAVREKGLERHFIFTGFVKDIRRILAASDLVVFPSLSPEGFGRPLIEGMAAGLPVVATDIGPTREIVGENAALLVKPGDVKGLARTLSLVLQHPKLAEAMAEYGRRRAGEMFCLDRHLSAIQEIYKQVVS